jgi:hypothetical protein
MAFYEKTFTFGRTRIAVIAFAVLLLLPAIGIAGKPDGGAALQTASAQFITPDGQAANATSVQNASRVTLKGFVGSLISTQDVNATGTGEQAANQSDYIVVGRWRMVVNESVAQRFVANLTMAKIDGSEHHSIFIESVGRHSELGNNTYRVTTQVYADGVLANNTVVPITLEIRDKVLRIADISVNERVMEGSGKLQDILRVIDGQSIYGIVEVRETG